MKSAKWENIFKGWNNKESETVHTLKKVPVFKNLSEKDFSELEKMMHQRSYASGEFIFKNKAPGEGMYIIMRGSIKITIGTNEGNENTLAELNKGEFFGAPKNSPLFNSARVFSLPSLVPMVILIEPRMIIYIPSPGALFLKINSPEA